MASNQTANFGLNQWAAADQVLRTDFNADNQKIDAALAALGNCRIATGSYVGTGTSGTEHPCRLDFDFKPLFVFMNTSRNYPGADHLVWTRPGATFTYPINSNVDYHLTWEDRGVQWYTTAGIGTDGSPTQQLNEAGVEYHYIALGLLE